MMRRRALLAGSAGALLLPNIACAKDDDIHAWVSGGTDPSAYTHEEALAALVEAQMLPSESMPEFLRLANANGGNGREFSRDSIEEGMLFRGMTFGGKRSGSRRRLIGNVAAKPSVWSPDASRQMRTWVWEGMVNGKRMTVAYAVPLVCGNSSAILYRNGAPVCVPIPQNARPT